MHRILKKRKKKRKQTCSFRTIQNKCNIMKHFEKLASETKLIINKVKRISSHKTFALV